MLDRISNVIKAGHADGLHPDVIANNVLEEMRDPTDVMWKSVFGGWISIFMQSQNQRRWDGMIDKAIGEKR